MFCPQCGRELSAPGAPCLGCLVDASDPSRVAPPPPPPGAVPPPALSITPPLPRAPSTEFMPPPPPPYVAPTSVAPVVPPAPLDATTVNPTMLPSAPSGGPPPVRGRRTALVLAVAAVAVVGAAVGAFLVTRSDDETTSGTTLPGATVPGETSVATTLPGTPTTTAAGDPPSTAATSLPPTTVAPTAPPTTVFDPTAVGPVPPSAPTSGPGSPQVLSEPTPSGIPYATYAPSLAVAQQLGDALANDDWAAARLLEPDKAGVSDAQYLTGYDGLDRVSLVLVDVRPEGAGYRLLVVSVANERAGARTSLYCLEWTVDPAAGTVDQHSGVVGQIARVDRAVSPEEARLDTLLDTAMRTQCVWS